jgi:hypothetical protein
MAVALKIDAVLYLMVAAVAQAIGKEKTGIRLSPYE